MQGESLEKETLEQIYRRVFRELKPRTAPPPVVVQYRRFANVNSFIEFKDGRLLVRISDLLEQAPETVQEALAWILLCKLFRRQIPGRHRDRYRRYLNKGEVIRAVERLRQERGRKAILPAAGEHHDLYRIFDELNFRYFHGLMSQPVIGWSQAESRNILGHYDAAHNAIVLSRILDRKEAPAFVVEYVMYHEMLHLRHPVERRGGRRCIHTAEFRKAEEEFPQLKQAKEWMETILWKLPRRA
jgi:hypothetical protein